MKATIIISIVLLAVLGIGAGIYIWWPEGGMIPSDTTPSQQYPIGSYQSTVTPSGSGGLETTEPTTDTMVVPATQGAPIEINDITKREGVVEDSANPGIYYLAGASPTEETYTISYLSSDESFTVSVLSEPIGNVRQLAEQDLLNQLGISEYDACRLRYVVLTPASVNPLYAGKNLGFSFCPGATPL